MGRGDLRELVNKKPRPENRRVRHPAMMLSLDVTLGIFLLLAARDPTANRSLIAFTAWSSFAHAALMAVQAFRNFIARGELLGVALFAVIGVTLIVLAPAKQSMQSASAVGA